HHYGEDNWKFVNADYGFRPVRPTLDGEPSYENIPHGLHDSLQPRWTAADLRRYGYWSVFAGAAGFTYGENAIMQFYTVSEGAGSFGVNQGWKETITAPGAGQMQYLSKLLLSKPYWERMPDQSLVMNSGDRYDRLAATRGKKYAFIYTYTGRTIQVQMGKIAGMQVKASWYDPRTGNLARLGTFSNTGVKTFDPPGEEQAGNDWVLVLESI
ncbi:MAG: DUF4038 domain-containing protein, partial [Chitinophagaceae bacterium]